MKQNYAYTAYHVCSNMLFTQLYVYKCKNHSLNEYGCRDAPCEKSWKQGNPLRNTIKDTSTIMRNPLPELCREGLCMIVLVLESR